MGFLPRGTDFLSSFFVIVIFRQSEAPIFCVDNATLAPLPSSMCEGGVCATKSARTAAITHASRTPKNIICRYHMHYFRTNLFTNCSCSVPTLILLYTL